MTVRTKRGFARLEWQKLRERNEALDCRVYARAAAWMVGADRWSDARWQHLEDQLQSDPRVNQDADHDAEPIETAPPQQGGKIVRPRASRRRVISSGYMNR